MRVPFGPGYRIYYTQRGDIVYLLLVGGDKSSQSRDMAKARAMMESE